ncbi:C39 family peptidase [Streptococcus zalophi]|uniref:C39 family peptidase n=1 Tax=Streptococcus zalophi TaxID=640031 RepID=A0A934PAX8_9STRE|nr:C39 family peptidase [Streptococcus zalophi]MBJ8350287.1 C39 family peptidase [Streptococcus zalophi]MCR8968284.1 C39 family peptidase [Streptococcus zalophi]
MKKRHKILVLIVTVFSLMGLFGCRKDNNQKSQSVKSTTVETTLEKTKETTENPSQSDSVTIEESQKKSSENNKPENSQKEVTQNPQVIAGIPVGAKHQLSVEGQVQQVWNYCAPTTVSMMLSSKGVAVDQFQLAKEMGTYEPFGTHNRDAIRILNKHLFGYEFPSGNQAGYRLATVTQSSLNSQDMKLFKERLIQNIADGYPMYYTIELSKVYPGKKGEHNVIGTGYLETPDGKDIALLYYIDPSPVSQDSYYGGLKIITPEELLSAMVVCEEPNYAW